MYPGLNETMFMQSPSRRRGCPGTPVVLWSLGPHAQESWWYRAVALSLPIDLGPSRGSGQGCGGLLVTGILMLLGIVHAGVLARLAMWGVSMLTAFRGTLARIPTYRAICMTGAWTTCMSRAGVAEISPAYSPWRPRARGAQRPVARAFFKPHN